ncbi:MAG: hypothetical protein ACR2IT_08355 [Pirellulales bacterium]
MTLAWLAADARRRAARGLIARGLTAGQLSGVLRSAQARRRQAWEGFAAGIASVIVTLITTWSAGLASAAAALADADPCEVRIELTDGTNVAGTLDAIDDKAVHLTASGSPRQLPISDVRRVVRVPPQIVAPLAAQVVCCDGAQIEGDDVLWDGGATAAVLRGGARIEIPIERIKTVGWHARPVAAAAGPMNPPWREALPAEPASDLVAVSRGDAFELVECAITAISPETVMVVLDGERIPVKRGKVLGLAWLRPAAPTAAATVVTIAGGRLTAGSVAWTPRSLVLDGVVTIPGHLLETLDFAAGRTVALVSLPMEQVTAEPFFGGLATVEGMAAFFAPRVVPTPAAGADGIDAARRSLFVRPRTAAVWRVPADSRQFRARVVRTVGSESAAAVRVIVHLDERSVWEQTLDSEDPAGAIDVAVADARRLSITVDFVKGDMGCPVRFDDAVFEK